MPHPKDGKNNWVSRYKTLRWILWKKLFLKKSNILEARQARKIFGEAISSRIIAIFFLIWIDIRKNNISQIEAEKLAVTVDDEITLKILDFILNLIEKIKPDFLLSTKYMFPESNGTKS